MATTDASLFASRTHVGGYRILARLSEGGMGQVLLAAKEVHGFEKKVALKLVLPWLHHDPDYRELFLHEARIAARISHPNVAQVFDFGEDDGVLFLAMELVEGVTVSQILRGSEKSAGPEGKRGPPAELAALIIAQAARGLHAAHALRGDDGQPLGVVHRDISPQNLLVTNVGSTKVLDFGIARSRERAGVTEEGVVRGKVGYLAPEQVLGDPVDARTDVFQLGIVLFELLLVEPLFPRPRALASLIQPEALPRRLDETRSRIPAGYADIVARALASPPDARFPSAAAMASALDEVIARCGRPVTESNLGEWVRALVDQQQAAAPPPVSPGTNEPVVANPRPTGVVTAVVSPASLPVTEPSAPTPNHAAEAPWRPGRHRSAVALGAAAAMVVVVFTWIAVSSWTEGPPPAPPLVAAISPPVVDEAPEPEGSAPSTSPPMAVQVDGRVVAEVQADRRPPSRPGSAGSSKPRLVRSRQGATPSPPTAPVTSAAPVPSATGVGVLDVDAEPYGEVYADGRHLGPTPLKATLPVGSHDIEVRAPDSGEVRRRETVVIEKDGRKKVRVRSP